MGKTSRTFLLSTIDDANNNRDNKDQRRQGTRKKGSDEIITVKVEETEE